MTTGSALPTLPQSVPRGLSISWLHWFASATACQVACPPCTDQTGILPQPPGTFTSRLSTDWSPSPLLDITTTATGLFCWRDSHPLEWQLASLHGHFQPAQGQQRVRPFPLCPESDRQPSQRRMARRANFRHPTVLIAWPLPVGAVITRAAQVSVMRRAIPSEILDHGRAACGSLW